jgi:hypothetical protein
MPQKLNAVAYTAATLLCHSERSGESGGRDEGALTAPKPDLVILNAVKNLVLYPNVPAFSRCLVSKRKVAIWEVWDEILHCVQNDKVGLGPHLVAGAVEWGWHAVCLQTPGSSFWYTFSYINGPAVKGVENI